MKNKLALTEINTVIKLEKWLKRNCYPMNDYSINGNFIYEGFGLEKSEGVFQWFYTERGDKQIIKYFSSEKEAVIYALKKIKTDEHANRNYIGRYKTDNEVEKILSELKKRGIEYWTDKIPYGGIDDIQTRIFVIGCGINNAKDLIKTE